MRQKKHSPVPVKTDAPSDIAEAVSSLAFKHICKYQQVETKYMRTVIFLKENILTCYSYEDCQTETNKEYYKDQNKMPFGQCIQSHWGQPTGAKETTELLSVTFLKGKKINPIHSPSKKTKSHSEATCNAKKKDECCLCTHTSPNVAHFFMLKVFYCPKLEQ